MPKRKTASETTSKRTSLTVGLTARANRVLAELCERTGIPKQTLIERVLEWVAGEAPGSLRSLILKTAEEDMIPDAIRRSVEWLESQLPENLENHSVTIGHPPQTAPTGTVAERPPGRGRV
jgi:hypothetical protein